MPLRLDAREPAFARAFEAMAATFQDTPVRFFRVSASATAACIGLLTGGRTAFGHFDAYNRARAEATEAIRALAQAGDRNLRP